MTKRIREPRKRTRTVQIKFWATPEEKELIEKKMALTGIVHMGAYLRKMALEGTCGKQKADENAETEN